MDPHPHAADPGYRFCPRCGGELQLRVVEAHDPRERLACGRCGFVFYIDPKVAVGTIVRGEGGFLLLRRAIEPGRGKWVFPGGYVDRGETLGDAAVREALEETGVRIALGRLLNVYSYALRGIVMIVYEAEAVAGDPRATPEALEAVWFGAADVPWKDLAFPSTRAALRDYFLAHGLESLIPGDFDPGEEF
jgi:ADP-ribose pyrophosphatase YjhB (NUDIX family)